MKTVTINKVKYPIHFNQLVIINFGEMLGFTKMSEIQNILSEFASLKNDIETKTIKNIATLIYCGIEEGSDIKGVEFELTEKQILREFLDKPDYFMEIITSEMNSMSGGEVGEKKAKVSKKK